MVKTFRKGAIVRYIGDDENAKGLIFRVIRKSYNSLMVSFPIKYSDGQIHYERAYRSICDFELLEDK